MNKMDIETALEEIARPFADRRTNLFEVTLAGLDGETLQLRGRVLEQTNLEELLEGLHARFPRLAVETDEVEVLRQADTPIMWVGTNLTSMHNGTSFLAEQSTQMVNGTAVEVLLKQDRWGFVRQMDGYLGWTYLPYLSADSAPDVTHLVTCPVALLRAAPQAGAALATRVLGGTALRVVARSGDWAQVILAGGWNGWLPCDDLRAVEALPREAGARRETMQTDGFRLIGVPYLWGGVSAHGIDCSGFAQLLHRWVGITIPRDADMQFNAGDPLEPPYEPGDLLFFGEKGEQRRVTHVGVSLGGWNILHSSRSRNGVQVDDVQAVPHLREDFLGAATYLGR